MKQISERMDQKKISSADIIQMVRLRIRNLQAFKELQSYNDAGAFCFRHPLVAHKSERAELTKLLATDPQAFLRKHRNCLDSIRRYEGYLRNPDREARRKKDKELLKKHLERESIFKEILNEKN